MNKRILNLTQLLGYEFKNPKLLEAAMTHRSIRGFNNERLEFLGDSIINLLIAEALYHRFPHLREGELSRLRSSLVKGETLAKLAREFSLGSYLRLGAGEIKTGGAKRDSILADAMEAIIAAIYLDSNFETIQSLVTKWFGKWLHNLNPSQPLKDPKTRLQEFLQHRKYPLPIYEMTNVTGQAHAQTFTIRCSVETLDISGTGIGHTRRRAEQQAAEKLLNLLENNL